MVSSAVSLHTSCSYRFNRHGGLPVETIFLIGWHEAETFDWRERPGPRPKTIQFCRHLLRRHLAQAWKPSR
jgi:hypothetical protein